MSNCCCNAHRTPRYSMGHTYHAAENLYSRLIPFPKFTTFAL